MEELKLNGNISYERIMHKLVVINLKSSTKIMAGKKKTEHVYLAHSRSSVNNLLYKAI